MSSEIMFLIDNIENYIVSLEKLLDECLWEIEDHNLNSNLQYRIESKLQERKQ